MLYFYTQKPNNYFSKEFLKAAARNILGKTRGPQAVDNSISRGLKSVGIDYRFNCSNPDLDGSGIFFINDSLDALKWAINLKKIGKIKKLIAGPNLVISPDVQGSIIESKEIDKIILPSEWILELWKKFGFSSFDRVRIWAAGAEDGQIRKSADHIILYKKDIPENIYFKARDIIKKFDKDFKEIIYGHFSKNEYLEALDNASALVYLQKSESQGISLLESWMKDVPTIVFSKGFFEKNGKRIDGDEIAAPYLNSESGDFFHNGMELEKRLDELFSEKKEYNPRRYYLETFTDKICADKLLKIINEK